MRRDVFAQILASLSDPSISAALSDLPPLEDGVTHSPLVEVSFDDFAS